MGENRGLGTAGTVETPWVTDEFVLKDRCGVVGRQNVELVLFSN